MSEQPTVADYIVQRLAREGITDCFGVAGDFAFKLCGRGSARERGDPLDRMLQRAGRSVRGPMVMPVSGAVRCSMTTYAVGESSALNGVMGRYTSGRASSTWLACRRCVSSGSARSSTTRSATGSSRTSPTSPPQAACVSAVITPDNCAPTRWSGRSPRRERRVDPPTSSSPPTTPSRRSPDRSRSPYPRLPRVVPTWPRPLPRSPSGSRPPSRWPSSPHSRSRGSRSRTGPGALIEALGCPYAAMAMDKGWPWPRLIPSSSGSMPGPRRLSAVLESGRGGGRRYRRWRGQLQRDQHVRLLEPPRSREAGHHRRGSRPDRRSHL